MTSQNVPEHFFRKLVGPQPKNHALLVTDPAILREHEAVTHLILTVSVALGKA